MDLVIPTAIQLVIHLPQFAIWICWYLPGDVATAGAPDWVSARGGRLWPAAGHVVYQRDCLDRAAGVYGAAKHERIADRYGPQPV